MSYSTSLLRQAYQRQGVCELQELTKHTPMQVVHLIDEGERVYRQLETVSEMRQSLRTKLKQSWRTREHCHRDNEHCQRRQCECSYGDLREYMGLCDAKRRLDTRFDRLARECGDISMINSHILWHRIVELLSDAAYRTQFGTQLVASGVLTREQFTMMTLDGYFRVSGSIRRIVLEFGVESPQTVELRAEDAPHYPPRRGEQ